MAPTDLAARPIVHVIVRDPVLRRRILGALRWSAVGVAKVVDEAAAAADPAPPLVHIVAVPLNEELLETTVDRVRARAPEGRLLLVGLTGHGHVARAAIRAGADGFVHERDIMEALPPAVRAVVSGQLVFPRADRISLERPALSTRERQVLRLLVDGLANAEMAERLVLAESTIKSHLSTAYGKLGVGSRAEAVALIVDRDTDLTQAIECAMPGPLERPRR